MAVSGGKVVSGPVLDNPREKPAPDEVNAPHGWTWDRSAGRWRASKKRGNYRRAKVDDDAPAASAAPSEPGSGESRPDRDPDPAWMGQPDTPDGVKRKQTIADVPAQVRNDIAGFAGLVGAPLLALLQSADPYCGSVLATNFEPIMDAALPLICRSETIVSYFRGDKSAWMEWIGLAIALRPVATAIAQHHVFRTVEVRRDEYGIPQVVPRQRGGSEYGDNLTPPVPDYSSYAA